ncbi:MAG: hypothetical protein Q9M48_07135 [Rhodobacterales bacterium]|nr:hypothetical protein [Rhodobacterales bacterium]
MFRTQSLLTQIIWTLLAVLAFGALVTGHYSLGFLALITLAVSVAPLLVARWANITVPPVFIAAVVLFVAGTLFLGEAYDFYNRFWWWDIMLHGGSAAGFGLIGFVLVFMMFQGDRFAAPHFAIAVFAFCFAIAIGVIWEVFEFLMDQSFGLNMQKSGLLDTMGDLIMDMLGAFIGAGSGYIYLKGRDRSGLPGVIGDFVRRNPRFFPRFFGRFRK